MCFNVPVQLLVVKPLFEKSQFRSNFKLHNTTFGDNIRNQRFMVEYYRVKRGTVLGKERDKHYVQKGPKIQISFLF